MIKWRHKSWDLRLIFIIYLALPLQIFAQVPSHYKNWVRNLPAENRSSEEVDRMKLALQDILYDDPDSALELAHRAYALAEHLGLKRRQAECLKRLGSVHSILGDQYRALDYYSRALALYQDLNDEAGMAAVYNNIGITYTQLSDYPRAVDHYFKCIRLREKLNDRKGLAKVWHNLAALHETMKEYDKALALYRRSLSASQVLEDTFGMADTYLNIGAVLLQKEVYDEARREINRGMNLYDILGDKGGKAACLTNLGLIAKEEDDFDRAAEYQRQALDIQERLGDDHSVMVSFINLGHTYMHEGRIEQALTYLQKALSLAQRLRSENDRKIIFRDLSQIYAELGQFETALSYFYQFSDLQDSLFNQDSYQQVADARIAYEREKMALDLLEKEKALSKEKFSNLLLFGGLVLLGLLLVLAILMIRNYQQRQENMQAVMQHKEVQNRQLMVDLLKGQEVESLNAMLEGQEQERQRIAIDLHDGLGGTLAAVQVSLHTLVRKLGDLPPEVEDMSEKTSELLRQASAQMRRISHDLADSTLENGGLIPALEEMCNTLADNQQFELHLQTDGLEPHLIDSQTEVNLYRIAQELFQNVVKHADASYVSLKLTRYPDHLSLEVLDDGKGFDYQTYKASNHHNGESTPIVNTKGIGLSNVAARARKIGAALEVDSIPGEGTSVRVEVPV